MADKTNIEVADLAHVALLAEWGGMLSAKAALEKQAFGKLPGYALAESLVAELAARLESRCMALNLQLCAKEGVDIAEVASIQLSYVKGAPVLVVKYLDLVDMAEDGQ